jgi:hypothetical protein
VSTATGVHLSRSQHLPADQATLDGASSIASSTYRGVLLRPRVAYRPLEDQVSLGEAAQILGCSVSTVRRLVITARTRHGGRARDGALVRANVEALATEVYSWRLHLDDADPYWLTGQRAADVLHVSRARLSQLASDKRVPFVRHQDGTRLYRRDQLEMIAISGAVGRRAAALAGRMQNSAPLSPDGG